MANDLLPKLYNVKAVAWRNSPRAHTRMKVSQPAFHCAAFDLCRLSEPKQGAWVSEQIESAMGKGGLPL